MAKILGNAHSDDATLSVTSEVATMPVSNLQNTQPSMPWRSTSAAAQTISWSTAKPKLYNAFVLYGHNLIAEDSVQFQLANDAGFTDVVYDVTLDAGMVVSGLGLGTLGVDIGLGGYLAGGSQHREPVVAHFFEADYSAAGVINVFAEYGRIILTHNGASLSYIQAARFKSGFCIESEYNVDTGYEVGYALSDELIETYANNLYSIQRPRYREAIVTWSFMEFGTALRIQNLIFQIGSTGDVFISPYYFEKTSRTRFSEILGKITAVSKIKEVVSGPISTSKYQFSAVIREGL